MAPLIHSSHFDAAKMSNVKIQMPNEAQNPNVKWNSRVEGHVLGILAF
jgi:hypothetical protein